ncbi:DUF4326 domain-containing protein [Prescottella agglutinans]|uniref:DUF4326 domain-containing protein n=1 Tax=Prescottella agglutinans TaxID=1644129 RepID=UPI00314551E8
MPQRIQRRRTRGWRMPEGAVYVGRPSGWGNPFKVGEIKWMRRHSDDAIVQFAPTKMPSPTACSELLAYRNDGDGAPRVTGTALSKHTTANARRRKHGSRRSHRQGTAGRCGRQPPKGHRSAQCLLSVKG